MSSTDNRASASSSSDQGDGFKRITDKAGAEAEKAANKYAGQLSDQLSILCEGLRAGADKIAEQDGWGAQSLRSAADRISNFAGTVRSRSVGDLMEDARQLCYSNPGLFYASCAAAGFALGRFISASTPRVEPGGEYDTARDFGGEFSYVSSGEYGASSQAPPDGGGPHGGGHA